MTAIAQSHTVTRPSRLNAFDPTWLLWLAIIAVLLFLVVSPFVYLVVTSFQNEKTGAFTFANYGIAYGRQRYVDALLNSLQLGAGAALLAGAFAVPLAWAVSRTNMPGRGFVRMMVLATFITPPYTGAVAWILLAGPNAGWLNRIYVMLTGAEAGPFNIYSFPGLVVVIALYSFPYIFIFTNAALELVSSEMEDAANILGAGAWRTMRKVTLPLALPAILGGLIICFLEAIALFASPAMIAIPARFNVVTTQLFQFFGNPVRVEVAAAYAMPLLGVTVLLFLVQRLITRRKGFVSLTGKGVSGGRSISVRGAGPCSVMPCSWAPCRCSCLTSSCCRRPSPKPGAGASPSKISRSRTSISCCSSMPRRRTRSGTASCSVRPRRPPA